MLAPNLGELLKLLDTKLAENLQVTTEVDDDGIEMFALDNTHLSDALKAIVKSRYL
ncbi:hypothetical protein [Nostoc piscinale]|uniref:hypothetical protein n=1 Tax=Nostoc piscinale TaxID=224012 RepID=UPI000AC26A07|nr:hypothetical protein [Nostoc piscinale]